MREHPSFEKLRASLSEASLERVRNKTAGLRQDMLLAEIRKAMSLTQTDLAGKLNIKQPALACLENRTDMSISSLRTYITALGGELDIVARFPEGDVYITSLHTPQS